MRKKNLLEKIDPPDLIAVVTLVGGFILMSMKIDTVVGGITTMVAAFYFGSKAKK